MSTSSDEVTRLLLPLGDGNEVALEKLRAVVSEELHRLAHRRMRRERQGHTLQTTALLNEAFVELISSEV